MTWPCPTATRQSSPDGRDLGTAAGGRLILALGGGAPVNHRAFGAFGLARRSPEQTEAATEEAIDVLRGLWCQPSFSYAGRHFSTRRNAVRLRG